MPKDYERCVKGGAHLNREIIRVSRLKDRLEFAINIECVSSVELVAPEAFAAMSTSLEKVRLLLTWLKESQTKLPGTGRRLYQSLNDAVVLLNTCLTDIVPQ